MAHSDQFLAIWTAAKKRYAEVTGEDMDATPFPHPSSLQDLQASLERQNNQFVEFRGKRAKLFKVLSGICYPIELLNNLAAGGAATVFPPSSLCFGAIMCLINAARGVSTYYDAIIDLMGTLKDFLVRLSEYNQEVISLELREKLAAILAMLIEIFGRSTKIMKRAISGRFHQMGKNIIFGHDKKLDEMVAKLGTMIESESGLVGAETLTESKRTGRKVDDIAVTLTEATMALSHGNSVVDRMSVEVQQLTVQSDDFRSEIRQEFGNMMAALHAGKVSANEDHNQHHLDKIKKILHPTVNPADTLSSISKTRVPGTGDWIRSEDCFKSWMNQGNPILLILGNPGSGKTYVSGNIISYLEQQYPQGAQHASRTSIGYFFFKDNDPSTRCFGQALNDLAYQISLNDPVYAKYLNSSLQSVSEIGSLRSKWDRLFVDYFVKKENTDSEAYVVLDGVDEAYEAELKSFLQHLVDLKNAHLNSSRGLRIHIVMVGRPQIIDDIEETLEVSVPQIHVDWRKNNKDIVDYLRASIKKSKVLRAAKKDLQDEVVKTLSDKSNGMFMWVDLMMQELSKKSRPGSIRESLHRAPKGLEKMLQHVLKGYSSMLKEDDSEDLNIMLMWVTCAARPLCLAELDVVLKLQSPEGDEVLFLEGKLRRQFASFFVLRREDHLSTADLQGDVPKTELASDDVGGEDLDNVENETYFESNPHTTTVAFCHASIGDFFREVNNGKVSAGPEDPAIGVNIVEAKVGVLKECLSFICNYHEMVKKIPDCRNLGDYVNCSWYTHLKEAAEILDKVSTTHRQEIGTLLVKMLREEAIMMTWARVRRCAFFTSDTLKALKIWLECPELLEVLGSEDRLWIERIQANQSEIFRPCAKFYASKWLRSSYWSAHQCMLVVHNISNLLLDRTDRKITDSSQNVSVQLISEAAEWAQFERTALWHRRLAICFRGNGHYDEGLRHFEKALELDETMWVAKNGVARTLAARGEYEKAIELGKAVDTILEKLLSEARESNHADSKHVSAADRVSINSLMADWYRKLLDYKSAMKHFKKAMELDSQRYDIIHDYICILGVQGEFEEIVSSLKLIDENSENQKYTNLIIMLSKYVWWDDCFFEFVLGASRETQQLQWLQDIYEKAVVATKKRQLPVEATVLEVCLSIIYKWLGVQGDKLEHLFENVLKFVVRPGALENSSIQRCQEFIAREYGRYCLEKAYSADDDSKVARYVRTLERLSKIKSKATDDNKEVLTTRLSAVYLGIWHHLHGRELEAREYLKPSLKQALMLLSDADPSNDIEGYWMVAMVLVAAGEDESARAVLHAIRPTEKVERYAEMSELWKPLKRAKEERRKNKEKNESESDDKAPSSEVNRNGRENDPFSITTSLTSSSEEGPLERGEDKYPGELWYYPFTCDGPCDRDFPLYIKVNMCHICLRDICDDCLKLIHDGHESARLTCSKDHKWLHVDPPSKEVEEGEILVGDKVVKLEEFVQELRKKWVL